MGHKGLKEDLKKYMKEVTLINKEKAKEEVKKEV